MKQEQNHIAEIIQVANGEMLKKDYANLIGVDPTRISAKLNEDFARAIKKLQVEKIELQSTCNQLQATATKLQAEVNNLKAERNTLQESEMELQEQKSELQGLVTILQDTCDHHEAANKALQETKVALQYRIDRLESDLTNYQGQPKIIQLFGSSTTRAILAVLLAAFEIAGTIHLLAPKGYLLAVPVGVAMGYSLLAFASAGNFWGKWFCILFSFAVGAIFFEPWATGLPQDWLFAFVPPVVNALIVNSFNQRK